MKKHIFFMLIGGLIGGIVVFLASISINQVPTSLFRSAIGFISGSGAGIVFYGLYSMIIYDTGEKLENSFKNFDMDEEADGPLSEEKVKETSDYVKDLMSN
ncbi:hypothetical protein [Alkalicoccus daliensis]|uniref:Uncharacterized protein n=1 Tax=Alkalicoccus daliensis TaxID=745820 RepID=A0A1H0A5W7_9BACI|nr:hypothetical protein [Alkalicoccus daliensis]SDN28837.1 hypothetical protein SAMN04488053_101362 [Alkalicoccus daliensis]